MKTREQWELDCEGTDVFEGEIALMAGVNKVILVGRLGGNPEVRYTSNGGAVANFSVATSENWLDKSGQKQERTEWHRIVVWGKLAEICGQYLAKGRQVFVEGRLQTKEWTDKEGHKRYTTEVIGSTVQFLGSANERGATSSSSFSGTSGGSNSWEPPMPSSSESEMSEGGFPDLGGQEESGFHHTDVPF